jgi:hypothetical protein
MKGTHDVERFSVPMLPRIAAECLKHQNLALTAHAVEGGQVRLKSVSNEMILYLVLICGQGYVLQIKCSVVMSLM